MVCGSSALGCLAAGCLEEDVGMFLGACVIEVKLSNAAEILDDEMREAESEDG